MVVWNFVEDNFVAEKEEYKQIGPCGFYCKLFEKDEDAGFEREYMGIHISSILFSFGQKLG